MLRFLTFLKKENNFSLPTEFKTKFELFDYGMFLFFYLSCVFCNSQFL